MIHYFIDPILRGPTLGSMLMCLGASLVGVLVLLRKQALIGESLSHAAYPGVIGGVILAGFLKLDPTLLTLLGAAATALVGLWAIHFLIHRLKVKSDSALCFILAAFFGIGLTLASHVQFAFTNLYRQAVVYLYGQAATMTDIHILIYGILAFAIVVLVILFHKELQVMTFDRSFAKSIGIPLQFLDFLLFLLIVLAVVVGIRSVGVVLMSAMLIAPAVAARQLTNHFGTMLFLAALFGLASGFLGNYLSVELGRKVMEAYPGARVAFPTGPMIVLVASGFCMLALLGAPERGLILRLTRARRFRHQCRRENLLKAMWRYGEGQKISLNDLKKQQNLTLFAFQRLIWDLSLSGWIKKSGRESLQLTSEGWIWASRIVRLHRLWEVYLVDYLGMGRERVHYSAEEMEHIITPELEEELMLLLHNPKQDPHQQPIPPKT